MEFYLTKMGKQFYMGTMPTLVREIEALNENIARLADAVETLSAGKPQAPEQAPEKQENKRYAVIVTETEDNNVRTLTKTDTIENACRAMMRELEKIAKSFGADIRDPRVSYGDFAAEFRHDDGSETLLHVIDL